MKCIYCNSQLAGIDYCPGCGADVTLVKRIGRISNLLYNQGLEKASIRDMSGAIGALKQSLKFNKENIDARNLLGLCYYETGEVVLALCEWVVSKNMSPKDNRAEEFLNDLQNNKNQLDVINQSIRKYNQSIEYCRSEHEDMAIMQLRKVVSSNPKLVKAQQLLALLYIKNQEYEKARRMLKKAQAIDNTNTTTIRYLSEVEEATGRSSAFGRRRSSHTAIREAVDTETFRYMSGTETVIQPTTFRDSSTIATFINIGLGVLLGGSIIWFLAVPANRQKANEQANQQVIDANLQLSSGSAQLSDLQAEIDTYQSQVEAANQEKEAALSKAGSYEELLSAANQYVSGEVTAAVDALGTINSDQLDGSAKTLYESITKAVGETMFNQYYTAGTTAYVQGDYATAASQLKSAVDSDPDHAQQYFFEALYYLGFAYYYQGDSTLADETFNKLIELYPNQASSVQPYLSTYNNNTGATYSDSAASQGEASMSNDQQIGQAIGESITVVENTAPAYDESLVAWTDPTTGLHYDMYGNLLG